MNLYADNILEHFRHPQCKGDVPGATVTREEINVGCGDTLTLHVKIADGCIAACGWEGTGCAISQAAMSMLAGELAGMSVDDARNLPPQRVRDLLGVPVGTRRLKCAFLCLHALKNALRTAAGQTPQSWEETLGLN
ncbi:MAG: nitrogen fixation protein NifU [Candidatus Peregrinibacteria bacterium Gr01-1014_25]|nr:MAG: nitrogen fixation protein NifU [Candidatus Peregrinibacteria bacterium Gr01-1014_25]